MESSQSLGSITVMGWPLWDIETVISVGDADVSREGGDSTAEDSRLDANGIVSCVLALSFPVGPFPSGSRCEGGICSASRR